MSADEINVFAMTLAKILTENKTKKEIAELKFLLQQIICNLCTYLLD